MSETGRTQFTVGTDTDRRAYFTTVTIMYIMSCLEQLPENRGPGLTNRFSLDYAELK